MKKKTKSRISLLLCFVVLMTFFTSFNVFADEIPTSTEEPTNEKGLTEIDTRENEYIASLNEGWEMTPVEYGLCFEKEFFIQEFNKEEKMLDITFSRIFFNARLYVNGAFVMETEFSYATTTVDISDYVEEGSNKISFYVTSGLNSIYGDGSDMGIYGDVYITCKNRFYVDNVDIYPDISTGDIRFEICINSSLVEEREELLLLNVYELGVYENGVPATKNGVGAKSEKITISEGEQSETLSWTIDIRDFEKDHLWTPSTPFLYEVTVTLGNSEKSYKFGFSDVSTDLDGGSVLLNNSPAFLAGIEINTNIIEELSLYNEESVKEFLTLIKKSAYVNLVKAKTLILPEYWYTAADEVGVWLVFEYPIGVSEEQVNYTKCAEEILLLCNEFKNHVSCLYWDLSGEDDVVSQVISQVAKNIEEIDTKNRPVNTGLVKPVSGNSIVECDVSLLGGNVTLENVTIDGPLMFTEKEVSWSIKTVSSVKVISNIASKILLDNNGDPIDEDSKLWWDNFLPDSSQDERIEALFKTINKMLHLWRVSRKYGGIIVPSTVVEVAASNGTLKKSFLVALNNAYSPVALTLERTTNTSGRGDTYKVEVALTSNMREDLDPVDVTFSLMVGDTVLISEVKQYDSIKKYGTSGRDVVIRDFSFVMPKSIEDGTTVTIVATCKVNNMTIETTRDIVVVGGEPYEASYSELAVIISVVSAGAVVLTGVIIAFINTKKDQFTKK